MSSKQTKQVLVIRRDLNMRKGKMCAQAAHASMSFLTLGGSTVYVEDDSYWAYRRTSNFSRDWNYELTHWLNNSFRKITVYVNSDEELLELYERCKDNKLVVHLITDNGATEFNGIPTRTCLAIGPHWDDRFVNLTDHLPLL